MAKDDTLTNRELDAIIADALGGLLKHDQAHVAPMRERLTAAGVKGDHFTELYQAWSRVIRTQQNVLARLRGEPKPRLGDYDETTGRIDNPLPTLEQLEVLTDDELVQAIEAAELSAYDCGRAVRSLNARDGSGPADYWLGDDAPSALFTRLGEWFDAALVLLRRLRQRRALADHREGTQFQPLRPGRESKSHNVNMSPAAHAAFARLSPVERGDLIEKAISEARAGRP